MSTRQKEHINCRGAAPSSNGEEQRCSDVEGVAYISCSFRPSLAGEGGGSGASLSRDVLRTGEGELSPRVVTRLVTLGVFALAVERRPGREVPDHRELTSSGRSGPPKERRRGAKNSSATSSNAAGSASRPQARRYTAQRQGICVPPYRLQVGATARLGLCGAHRARPPGRRARPSPSCGAAGTEECGSSGSSLSRTSPQSPATPSGRSRSRAGRLDLAGAATSRRPAPVLSQVSSVSTLPQAGRLQRTRRSAPGMRGGTICQAPHDGQRTSVAFARLLDRPAGPT